MSLNLSGIETVLNNLTPTGVSNLASLGGVTSLLGGQPNAPQIGSLLGKAYAFYAAGNAGALTTLEITVESLLSNPSPTIKEAIANVWAQTAIPNNASGVASAISAAQAALGV